METNQNSAGGSNIPSGVLASAYGSQSDQNVSSGSLVFSTQAEYLNYHVLAILPGNNGGIQSTIESQIPPTDDGWIDWNIDDWGGGFVPDISYWGSNL
jgi:hypothetical protein